MKKNIVLLLLIFMLNMHPIFASNPPYAKINIEPYSVLYEGDIIDCNISNAEKILLEN